MAIKIFDVNIDDLTFNGTRVRFLNINGQEVWSDPFDYELLDNGTYAIRGTEASAGSFIIPSTYKGIDVTEISSSAFPRNKQITHVTIQDNITTIGSSAFYECTNLRGLNIQAKITNIPGGMCYCCYSLEKIKIPDGVEAIGAEAFYLCGRLYQIILPKTLKRVYENAFFINDIDLSEGKIMVLHEGAKSDVITYEDGNKLIDPTWIYSTHYYYSETEPASDKDDYWHYGADGKPALWGSGCIDGHSWKDATCTEPKTCKNCGKTSGDPLGHSPNAEGKCVRDGCDYVEPSQPPETEEYFMYSLGVNGYSISGVIEGKTLPSEVNIPRTHNGKLVTAIANRAFWQCKSIISVTIPDSVVSIGYGAFWFCENIISIEVPDSVISIGAYAFAACSNLERVVIGDSVETIGDYVFAVCNKLTSISVDENNQYYKSINGNLYSKDGNTLIRYAIGKADTSFEIPNGVTTIGDTAFVGCKSIVTVTIPNSVNYIGTYALGACPNLTNIIIDKNHPYYYVEDGCLIEKDTTKKVIFGSATAYIPNSASAIGTGAFYGGTYYAPIKIPLSITTIEPQAFVDCGNLVVLVEATEKLEGWADDWCDETVTVIWGYTDTDTCEHIWGDWEIDSKPTCTRMGRVTSTCTICGKISSQKIAPFGHVESDWIIDVEPTTETEGSKHKECLTCGEILEVESIPMLGCAEVGHSYSANIIDDPTCTDNGNTTYTCTRCGHSYTEVTAALGHDYKVTQNVAQNCVKDGYVVYTCSKCGDTYTKVVKADGVHSISITSVVEPTCTEQGYTVYTCDDCGNTYKDNYTKALGHSWSEWEDVNPATCEIDGMRERKCTRCGETETETIVATGHEWDTEVEVVKPTCTDGGYTIHKCNNCAETYTDNYTESLGHSSSDWIIDKEATVEAEGSKHKECTRCGEILETTSIPKLEDPNTYLVTESGEYLTDEQGNKLII